MPLTIKIDGFDALQARVKTQAVNLPDEIGQAIQEELEIEATEVRARTPVDTGALRSTVHVTNYVIEGTRVSAKLIAGGSQAPYAVEVHENLEAFHPVGEAKYLEGPLLESRPFFGKRVANRVRMNSKGK